MSDGRYLISRSGGEVYQLWDVPADKPIRWLIPAAIAWSAALILTPSPLFAHVWSRRTGRTSNGTDSRLVRRTCVAKVAGQEAPCHACKRSPPACGSTTRPRRRPGSTPRSSRTRRSSTVTRYSEAGQEIHGKQPGSVMTVEFELDGQPFTALNGGPVFKFNEAISFQVHCDTQDEIDHYWEKLSAGGDPKAQQCGWLKDKFGVSWQVVPRGMAEMLKDPRPARRERAMAADAADEEARHRRTPAGVRGMTTPSCVPPLR